jgi:hypothetical protein
MIKSCGSRFENVVISLRESSRITIMKNFLQRVHILSNLIHSWQVDESGVVNARIVLAGYMISFHTAKVFETVGVIEKNLIESSTALLQLMEKIAKELVSLGSFQALPKELTKNFHKFLMKYLNDFKTWKVPDEQKLTTRIKHALVALEEAQMQLPADEPTDSKLAIELRVQIERLRGKLAHVGGPAVLRQFDESRAAWRASATRKSGSNEGETTDSFGGRVSNEALAHELLLDPAFQLNDDAVHTVQSQININIRNSFHDVRMDLFL